jgi:hypothetical protein
MGARRLDIFLGLYLAPHLPHLLRQFRATNLSRLAPSSLWGLGTLEVGDKSSGQSPRPARVGILRVHSSFNRDQGLL